MAKIIQLSVSTGSKEDAVYALTDNGEVWLGVLQSVSKNGKSKFSWVAKLPPVPFDDDRSTDNDREDEVG